jgi:hypothetical protein
MKGDVSLMIIRFTGLMTHVHANNEDFVVLYREANHEPCLVVRDLDLEGGSEPRPFCFPLNSVVSFSDFPNTPVGRSGLLHVPRMSHINPGTFTPRSEIQSKTVGPDFAAFIVLSGGVYSVADFFPAAATIGVTFFPCVARTVLFTVTPGAPFVTVNGVSGLTRRVSATGTIYINNASHMPNALNHFEAYEEFFDPPFNIISPPAEFGTCPSGTLVADLPGCGPTHNVGVECTNTQFP